MPTLAPGKPVRSARPTLLVENALKAGDYRFRLVVVDDSGNESAPAEIRVTVRGARNPSIDRDRVVRRDPRPRRPVRPVVRPRRGGDTR